MNLKIDLKKVYPITELQFFYFTLHAIFLGIALSMALVIDGWLIPSMHAIIITILIACVFLIAYRLIPYTRGQT